MRVGQGRGAHCASGFRKRDPTSPRRLLSPESGDWVPGGLGETAHQVTRQSPVPLPPRPKIGSKVCFLPLFGLLISLPPETDSHQTAPSFPSSPSPSLRRGLKSSRVTLTPKEALQGGLQALFTVRLSNWRDLETQPPSPHLCCSMSFLSFKQMLSTCCMLCALGLSVRARSSERGGF